MKDMPRTKRLIVVPPSSTVLLSASAFSFAHEAISPMRLARNPMSAGPGLRSAAARAPARGPAAPPTRESVTRVARSQARELTASMPSSVRVVDTAPVDGAMLIDPQGSSRRAIVRSLPPGTEVFEEKWYRLERSGAPWLLRTGRAQIDLGAGAGSQELTVKVRAAGASTGLADVSITVLLGRQMVEAKTSRSGVARLRLPARARNISRIYIDPLHSAWPIYRNAVPIGDGKLEFEVPALDPDHQDTRNLIYGRPKAAGRGVKVAVVDSGVGPHGDLKVVGGRNTTEAEPDARWTDWDGHGTHVAGVIASTAQGWRKGEASQVELYAYRVFAEGEEFASNSAIRSAIVEAAVAGCCLINLSVGGGDWDPGVEVAVATAWNLGAVCVAASGNDGAPLVDVPARYPWSLGISAIGLEGSWVAHTTPELELTDSPGQGRQIAGRRVFVTGFSNWGDEIDFTAPGSAIVSTIFGNRLGVMSGTSMATPVATGVLAARIAAKGLHTMPPTAERAAAIVKLAKEAAEKIGLPAVMQGSGLVR